MAPLRGLEPKNSRIFRDEATTNLICADSWRGPVRRLYLHQVLDTFGLIAAEQSMRAMRLSLRRESELNQGPRVMVPARGLEPVSRNLVKSTRYFSAPGSLLLALLPVSLTKRRSGAHRTIKQLSSVVWLA
jgi:hypothetical protein